MSSRSNGVTNVASSRWPISWLISSPRCSVARISAARASALVVGPEHRLEQARAAEDVRGILHEQVEEPLVARDQAETQGTVLRVGRLRELWAGSGPSRGVVRRSGRRGRLRVPRPARTVRSSPRWTGSSIGFVGSPRDRARGRRRARPRPRPPARGCPRRDRPDDDRGASRRLGSLDRRGRAGRRRGRRRADPDPPPPRPARRIGVRARPAGPERVLPGRPHGRRHRPARRRRPGRARECRRPHPPPPPAGLASRPDGDRDVPRRPGRGADRGCPGRRARRRASSG